MTVQELNRDQLIELKQAYIFEQCTAKNKFPSYGDLADADQTISDKTIFEAFSGHDFGPDDFCCTAGGREEMKA